jgi:hypothetical protein
VVVVAYKCAEGLPDASADAAGDGLNVTGTLCPGEAIAPAGDIPGAPGDVGGAPGDITGIPGDMAGMFGDTPGATGCAGDIPAAGDIAGCGALVAPDGGVWPNEANVRAIVQRQTINDVFIVETKMDITGFFSFISRLLSQMRGPKVEQNFLSFFPGLCWFDIVIATAFGFLRVKQK